MDIPSPQMNYTEGDTMNMTCMADALPTPDLVWTINDIPVDDARFDDTGIIITQSTTSNPQKVVSWLMWPEVTHFPMAIVSCQASNAAGYTAESVRAMFAPISECVYECIIIMTTLLSVK